MNLFEALEGIVCTVGSEMWISALATLIARKNKCNLVLESQMVNSVSVKQACPLIALPFCIDHIQSYPDLCAYKLYFRGFGMAYLYLFLKIQTSLHQETRQLQHGISKTITIIAHFLILNNRPSTRFRSNLTNVLKTVNKY